MKDDKKQDSSARTIVHFSSWARTFTQFRIELLDELQKDSINNILICSPETPHSERLRERGYTLKEYCFSKKIDTQFLKSVFKLRKFIKNVNPEILALHQPIALLIGVLASFFLNVRIFYFTGGLKANDSMGNIKRRITLNIEKLFLSRCEAIFNVNMEDVDELRRQRLKSHIHYVGPRGGCGINTEKFQFMPEENIKIREKLGINKNSIVIGMVGRIEHEKGIFVILEKFQNLAKNNKNIYFLVIGAGKASSELEHSIASLDLNLKQKIHYVGRQENIYKWYSCIDIFILASKREGMPTSLLEAMSCQCLVLSTNVRGSREVINHNINGYIYKDTKKLVSGLPEIIRNIKNIDHIKTNARQTVLKKYSTKKLLPNTLKIIKGVIQQ